MQRRRGEKHNYKKILFIFSLVGLSFLALYFLSQLLPTVIAFIKFKNTNVIINPLVTGNLDKDMYQLLREKNIDFSDVKISSDGATIIVTVKDDSRAIFSKNKDIGWQISSLQAIIFRLTIDNKKASYIDLRFDQPIVKLK